MAFQIAGGAPLRILALDGALCEPFEIPVIRLAPAQRFDVIADLASDRVAFQEVSTGEAIDAAQLVVGEGGAGPVAPPPRAWYPRADADGARVIDIHMQGGAMGNLGSAMFEGEEMSLRQLAKEHFKLRAFNGEIGGYGVTLADLALGEVAVLRLLNDTR